MALEDVVSPNVAPTTRRAVLSTGARLAYSAPIVAATMRIGTRAALAVSSDGCPECYVRSSPGGTCIREAVVLPHGVCPCGFEEQNGQCVKDGCQDCYILVGGVCVPEPEAPANGRCECGFEEVGGICVPRYPFI